MWDTLGKGKAYHFIEWDDLGENWKTVKREEAKKTLTGTI